MKEAGLGKPSGVSIDDSLSVSLLQLYQILAAFWEIYFFADTGPKLSQDRRKRVEPASALVEGKGVSVDLHSSEQHQPGLSHLSPCAVKHLSAALLFLPKGEPMVSYLQSGQL